MSCNYDQAVFDAKQELLSLICDAVRLAVDEGCPTVSAQVDRLSSAVERLKQAYEAREDALCRQRDERGREVLRLLDRLAEAEAK